MSRLVDLKLAEVNERGHYRALEEAKASVVGDDYFPAPDESEPVVEKPPTPPTAEGRRWRWISPQFTAILNQFDKKSGK